AYVSSVISSIRQMMSFANAMENLMPAAGAGSVGGAAAAAAPGSAAATYRAYLGPMAARSPLAAALAAATAAAAANSSSSSSGASSSATGGRLAAAAAVTEDGREWLNSLTDKRLLNGGNRELHDLVLQYLISQGHLEAAEAFRQEAAERLQLLPPLDGPLIESAAANSDAAELYQFRVSLREAVQSGRPADALNELAAARPGLLAARPELAFRLRLQQLLELVRAGCVAEALELSQAELAPLVADRPHLLPDLEECMALLAFERPMQSAAFGSWLSIGQRRLLACELNAALLDDEASDQQANGVGNDATHSSKLDYLLKLVLWSQDQLATAKVRGFPRLSADSLGEAAFQD
ncbi:hypothetical protein BOX15_Mlig011558g1, partial [Macrostomum lignano]